MRIGLLTVEFFLDGCRSLKEKRRRLSRLRDRFGKQTHLAVCESGGQDDYQHAQWSFVAIAANGKLLDQMLAGVEAHLEDGVDGRVVDSFREDLV